MAVRAEAGEWGEGTAIERGLSIVDSIQKSDSRSPLVIQLTPAWSSDTVVEDSREARTGLREKKKDPINRTSSVDPASPENTTQVAVARNLKKTARSTST